MTRRAAFAIVATLAVLANAAALANGFALDDLPIIETRASLHQWRWPWTWWGESYWPPTYGADAWRPWTMLLFNLQWLVGGGSPFPFHLGSLLLILGCSWLLWDVLRHAAPAWAATAGAALFAVHPVHVEAVSNAVGQAELWMTLATLAAVRHWLARPAEAHATATPWVLLVWYGIAASAKEQGFVLPLLLVVLEWARGGPWTADRRLGFRTALGWLAFTGLALGTLRTLVLGGLGNAMLAAGLADASLGDRLAMAATMLVEALRLLVWPASLAIDYGPPAFDAGRGWTSAAWLGAALATALVGVGTLTRGRSRWIAAGIAWMAIAWLPVANILVPTGILLAERTLLLPSAGVAVALAAGLGQLRHPSVRRGAIAAVIGLAALGIARSIARHRTWRDNGTLLAQAVVDQPTSSRVHAYHASLLLQTADTTAAIAAYERAVRLWPNDPRVLEELAQVWRARRRCDQARPLLRMALALDSTRAVARARLEGCGP